MRARSKRRGRQGAAVLALGLLAAGCGADREGPVKPRRSAIWVAAGSQATPGELNRLAQVGVEEPFVEAADLVWRGGVPELEGQPRAPAARRTGVTLVIRGVWPPSELPADDTVRTLAEALRELARDAERSSLVPLGFHFDMEAPAGLAAYADVLAALRGELDTRLFLSASVERRWLGREDLSRLAGAVDFLVAFLYGQRPGEPDEPQAWDLTEVTAGVERMEELGADYMLGVVTVGRAELLDRRDGLQEVTTGLSLGDLGRESALELGGGFSLEGADRQLHRFTAVSPVRVGDWRLGTGEVVRVVRLAPRHLEDLRQRVEPLEPRHLLGYLYYRLPLADEQLSLSVESLADTLASEGVLEPPRVTLTPQGRSGGRWRFTIAAENPADEPTEVARLLEYNYVELRARGGTIGRVDPGGFRRWELLEDRRGGDPVPAFRSANMVRLYTPILDGGERVETGVVEVVAAGGGEPEVTAGGRFLLSDRTAEELEATEPGDGEEEGGAEEVHG